MTVQLQPLGPVHTADRFAPLHAQLLLLLRGLTAGDWEHATAAGRWRVRDIAAHLLDGDLRRISILRDGHLLDPARELNGYADLVDWLDTLNAKWVESARRLSPAVLVDLLEWSGSRVAALMESLDPDGAAVFPVAWAGESASANWMDVAREYTERWHHQQQIRDAVGAAPLTDRAWLHPVLAVSVRALPHAYRDTVAPERTSVSVRITGDAGDDWSLVRRADDWTMLHGAAADPTTRVELDADTAWRLLFNALPSETSRAQIRVSGDERLIAPLLHARAVMVRSAPDTQAGASSGSDPA